MKSKPPSDTAQSSRRNFLKVSASTSVAAVVGGGSLAACNGSDSSSVLSPQPPVPVALPTALFSAYAQILSEPMLQNPGPADVRVVWFSELSTGRHTVRIGPTFDTEYVATTTRMSKMMEDSSSQVFQKITSNLTTPQMRAVFRHEARITGLVAGKRVPYVAISEVGGQLARSGQYTLQPLPAPGDASVPPNLPDAPPPPFEKT